MESNVGMTPFTAESGKKYADPAWDFRSANTKVYTHCFHNYPAMMIPQVAGSLIDRFGSSAALLFDPYCGSGTSLVESSLRGINSVGTDLNPLARLISRVKTTTIPMEELDKCINSFRGNTFYASFSGDCGKGSTTPDFKNIDYWFSDAVKRKLAYIAEYIGAIPNSDIQAFFKVCFSETIRESSWTRNGEFKLFRMSDEQRQVFDPDVYGIMEGKLHRARKGLAEFMRDIKGTPRAAVHEFNTVDGVPTSVLTPSSVDIIVTSPPYGDSRTTVAYGQYSRLSSQWLGFADAEKVDSILMGGKRITSIPKFDTPILSKTVQAVAEKDLGRSLDVAAFYLDYQTSISNVAKLIKSGGHACYVVGNRRVKSITLPTDEITVELFSALGFSHIETIVRNIPNKRMPSKNSPTNVTGELDSTMTNEFIVVMKREG